MKLLRGYPSVDIMRLLEVAAIICLYLVLPELIKTSDAILSPTLIANLGVVIHPTDPIYVPEAKWRQYLTLPYPCLDDILSVERLGHIKQTVHSIKDLITPINSTGDPQATAVKNIISDSVTIQNAMWIAINICKCH